MRFLCGWTMVIVCTLLSTVVVADELMPSDEDLAELYQDSCMACHTSAASGAPQTGDIHAWQPRKKKGLDELLNNTINGFKGMPALGSCSDCTEEDLIALIKFMTDVSQ